MELLRAALEWFVYFAVGGVVLVYVAAFIGYGVSYILYGRPENRK